MGSWRRSEIVGTTPAGNIVMSDYGHHPNEIRPTLRAIRDKYSDKQLLVVFQPHQYSRTRELLQEFANSFSEASELIIPNIYFSRDKQEDVEWMTVEKLIEAIQESSPLIKVSSSPLLGNELERSRVRGTFPVKNGGGLENTAKLIREYDAKNPNSSIILLLGAGDVDGLRNQII